MLLDENLPRQIRSVRNIEVHYCDLFPLLNPGHKLPSPALNAFGAIIQDVPCEQSCKATDNTLVLSSWIPALATGDATPARAEGSIVEHVQAACGKLPLDSVLKRPRWMIPLCGGCPSHWVLGIIDFDTKTWGIYDSIPELKSVTWAQPLFEAAIYAVSALSATHQVNLQDGSWTAEIHSPVANERQHDSWSCGIFVMMAMSAFKQQLDLKNTGDGTKDDMRARALRMLLALPVFRTAPAASDDYSDDDITQSNDYPLPHATPQAHTPYGPEVPPSLDIPSERKINSHVLDSSGKVSVTKMLESRRVMQSGTTTKSERVVQMDPKFALRRVHESAEKVRNNETEIEDEAALKEKLKASEASHRVRLHQSLHAASASQKKTRELRWQVAAKALRKALPDVVAANLATRNVTHFNPLEPGVFVIMRNGTREYIGEVLDIYKKGANGRYGSLAAAPSTAGLSSLSLRVYLPMQTSDSTKIVYAGCDSDSEDDTPKVAPHFTCRQRTFDLHTHASINHLIFNIGKTALTGDRGGACKLSPDAEKHWIALTSVAVLQKLPKLKIPGGRMLRT